GSAPTGHGWSARCYLAVRQQRAVEGGSAEALRASPAPPRPMSQRTCSRNAVPDASRWHHEGITHRTASSDQETRGRSGSVPQHSERARERAEEVSVMRKLVLLLVVVAVAFGIAKDVEFEPGFGPAASVVSGRVRLTDPEGEPQIIDAVVVLPALPTGGHMALTPGTELEVIARVERVEDGRLVLAFDETPVARPAYG